MKKKVKKELSWVQQYGVLLIIALLLLFFLGLVVEKESSVVVTPKAKESKFTNQKEPIRIQVSPTLIPSPTPVPSPTPLPGFCLYVPVLYYHHIQPLSVAKTKGQTSLTVDNAIFEQQMGYLAAQGYMAITADQLISALRNHTRLPNKSILITIDDGYNDVYDYAFPILKKYHLITNYVIPPGLISGSDYLSWSQFEEIAHSGLAYISNHTWSHYAMNHGTEEKMRFEVSTARSLLEQHSGQKVDIFTYPYGSFNDTAIKILQQEGVRGAFSTLPGVYQCDSFIMTLHRTRIGNLPLSSYGF